MRGVLLDPKDENIAAEFTEVAERLFSSQTQHARRFPPILSCSLCSLWLKTEFTEVTERLFSSQTQHTRRFPSILLLSVLSVAQNRVHRGHRETVFISDAAYAKISFHSLLLSVAQILIPLVINTAQGEDPIFRQPENDFGRGLLQSLRSFAMIFCKRSGRQKNWKPGFFYLSEAAHEGK